MGGKKVTYDGIDYEPGDSFVANGPTNLSGSTSTKARVIEANSLNSFNPAYNFSTESIVPLSNIDIAIDAMSLLMQCQIPIMGILHMKLIS